MRVDIGNALADVATPGVPRDALERLDDRVAAAHERIAAGRDAREQGYAALALPETVDLDAVREAVAPFEDPAAVLTVGIGGSALGAATVAGALDGPTATGASDSPADHHVLDNVDPEHTVAVLDALPLSETVVSVVSRSGTTTETLANFLVVRAAMERSGVDWTDRTVVTTGEDGPLRRLGERHDLPVLDAPAGVPGRFSALSTMGLVPAAVRGHDLEALVDGAADAADGLAGSLFDCPAYAYGAVCYALAVRGAGINAMMPYAESLEPFAEWFAQLWAESLGKDGVGQTPARALGATDQHSQLQLYRAGPRDKVVTLLRPREREDVPIPDAAPASGGSEADGGPASDGGPDDAAGELSHLAGGSLGGVIDAEFEATAASLAAAGRPTVGVEVERVDERGLGDLLYGMEAACVLAGELFGVETFTQPAVEWGKEAARELLAGDRESVAGGRLVVE